MAVLNKDEYFNAIHQMAGNDTSDESLTLIENLTDTYTDLEKKANGDGVDWEKKYHELDNSWKEKYRHRFFSGNDSGNANSRNKNNEEDDKSPEDISFNDLFSKK